MSRIRDFRRNYNQSTVYIGTIVTLILFIQVVEAIASLRGR